MPKHDFPLLLGGRAHQDLLTYWMLGFEISAGSQVQISFPKTNGKRTENKPKPKRQESSSNPTINFQMSNHVILQCMVP